MDAEVWVKGFEAWMKEITRKMNDDDRVELLETLKERITVALNDERDKQLDKR
jgi:hypothetical protein